MNNMPLQLDYTYSIKPLKGLVARLLAYIKYTLAFQYSLLMLCGTPACNTSVNEKTPNPQFTEKHNASLPKHFPEVLHPADNQPTTERIALGKMLLNDPILSKDSTVSCSSCHQAKNSFTQPSRFARGALDSLGVRNPLALVNVAYNTSFFWDGGVPSLELQVIAPIVNEKELHEDIDHVILKLNRHPTYPSLFEKAYNRKPDLYSLTRAIAAFERTLLSYSSKYDRYLYDSTLFTKEEKEGRKLFFSEKTKCSKCHSGFNFTSGRFENNGLYNEYSDEGRYRVSVRYQDIAKFKVPTLRNVALTAPYMHDGSIATLEEVIEHYSSRVKPHIHKSPLVENLALSDDEKRNLLKFLNTLTDTLFINKNR